MANEVRLIDANDAQAVKNALAMCYKQGITSECDGCAYRGHNNVCMDALMEDTLALINSLESCIDAQNTVDAVPVVRCKDCIHRHYVDMGDDIGAIGGCRLFGTPMMTCNDFCSYGERREGE